MKKIRTWAILLLIFVLACSSSVSAAGNVDLNSLTQETVNGMKQMAGADKEYILNAKEDFPAGNTICDWTAMALAIFGEEEAYADYLTQMEEYVTNCYKEQGYIDDVKATETQRIALTVLALGADPTAFGTDKEGNPVNLIADGTWNFAGDSMGNQGTNGYIYGLLLLDSKNYEIPEDAAVTRESIVESILNAQSEEGGFSLTAAGKGDIDITAMALQALAPYQDQENVKKAVEKALDWISGQMSEYATFMAFDTESCESSAQVLMAMAALGMDYKTDERFIKNGMTILDGMEQFRLEDGTYMHTPVDGTGDLMATQQALLALLALEKAEDGGGWIFDFTEYEAPSSAVAENSLNGDNTGSILLIGVLAVVAVIGAAVAIKSKKKNAGKE